jgi:hypothetical protein
MELEDSLPCTVTVLNFVLPIFRKTGLEQTNLIMSFVKISGV